jgi:hypothetical protein
MSTQFKLEKGSINDLGTKPVDPTALYLVDFSKLNSVNDLVVILSAMGISFAGSHPHFEVVKAFLNLDNPIYLNEEDKPKEKELKFPKLKPVK